MVALDQIVVEPVTDRTPQQMDPRKGFIGFSTDGLLLGTPSRRSNNREHTPSTRSIPVPTSTRRSSAR